MTGSSSPGVWGLYLPNKLHKLNSTLVHPLQSKHPDDPGYTLPVAVSKSRILPLPDVYRCRPLKQGEDSTKGDARTTVSAKAMHRSPNLRQIKLAPELLKNLRGYAQFDKEVYENHKTSRGVDGLPLPSAEQQGEAISRLAEWFSYFTNYDPKSKDDQDCVVVSEENIRTQVVQQIVTPLNLLLKMRYMNISKLLPVWRYSTESAKKKMSNLGSENRRGGDTDLVFSPGAICEIKTFWSIKESDIAAMLSDPLLSDDNDLDPTRHIPVSLGFLTNGAFVWAFCKAENDTLAISVPERWSSDDLLQILLGMSFVVMDQWRLPTEDKSSEEKSKNLSTGNAKEVALTESSEDDDLEISEEDSQNVPTQISEEDIQKTIRELCGKLISPFSEPGHIISPLLKASREQYTQEHIAIKAKTEKLDDSDARAEAKLDKVDKKIDKDYVPKVKFQPAGAGTRVSQRTRPTQRGPN
ncbi:hypothetical protein BDQ17DRAFT_1434028 [Cyathus striatus]|nr:hypothetical protein BDQ17DRAFT_1434028 [Cyathus striatus]